MRDGGIRLRTTKTASGATAVQAVRYVRRKVVVVKHFGSAHTPHELQILIRDGDAWIAKQRTQPPLPLLSEPSLSSSVVDLDRLTFSDTRHLFAYDVLMHAVKTLGFARFLDPVLADLIVMRLLEPSSKLRAITLLRRYFGIVHGRRTVYETLKTFATHKDALECCLIAYAVQGDTLALSLVFYDVTTLYFESFHEDEEETGLRKTGFSKDNKPQQPQVVIGLLVTAQGFPLGYEMFKGSTFEGHTMLPIIERFQETHHVETCTVVADAGMLSFDNIEMLRKKKFSYIVGARVGNLSSTLIEQVSTTLNRTDGATVRMETKHGDLLCSFSQERFRKDKYDMDKQIARAKKLVASRQPGRRAKFVHTKGTSYTLNAKLITKTEKLLGIKGYVTNIPQAVMSDEEVITHYRSLWHVEQTFRMAKSDLEMRPIFHRTDDAIRAHVLLCVVALAAQKHLEKMTGWTLRRIRDVIMLVTDVTLTDTVTGRTFTKRSALSADVESLMAKLGMPY